MRSLIDSELLRVSHLSQTIRPHKNVRTFQTSTFGLKAIGKKMVMEHEGVMLKRKVAMSWIKTGLVRCENLHAISGLPSKTRALHRQRGDRLAHRSGRNITSQCPVNFQNLNCATWIGKQSSLQATITLHGTVIGPESNLKRIVTIDRRDWGLMPLSW